MVPRWPLTGRGEELRVIREALNNDDRKGIVLAGFAGVGKTRLARSAAEVAAGGMGRAPRRRHRHRSSDHARRVRAMGR